VHLSDCGAYRYRLWREWDSSGPTLAFLMLNPSTADNLDEDPTLTRCLARAIANDLGRLEVVNLFPLRAPSPEELLSDPDALGPRNLANCSILEAVDRASMVICAWGSHDAAAMRISYVVHLLCITSMAGKLFHLGLNPDGNPTHPPYAPASRRPKQFMWSPS
jgi:hypothetical protein